jgi:hypothetical protein
VTSTGFERARKQLNRFLPGLALLSLLGAESAYAQAKLRLTETAIGPISVATGSNGQTQTIEAFNLGTGALSLTLASNATWLSGNVGTLRPCQIAVQQNTCLPVNILLNTATLTRGSYTGAITVRDPNAIDAPQVISVTVQVGGGVPDSIFLYTPPNGGSDKQRVEHQCWHSGWRQLVDSRLRRPG